jgi:hypothetical protein
MRKFAKPLFAVALSADLFGCAERQSPFEPLSVPRPALSVVPPSVSGFDLPLFDPSSPALADMALPTYADPVVALVSVNGRILVSSNHPNKTSSLVDASGYWRNDTIHGCYVDVKVTYGATVWPSGCAGPAQLVRSDTILVQGSGTVKRGSVVAQWPYECDYSLCWSYSLNDGAQTLSLQPLSPAIDILTPGTAQSPHGVIALPPPGTGTTVQVSSNPSTLKTFQVPIRVLSWSWTPRPGGDGATSVGCTGTKILCSMTFTETGSLVVTAIVNGTEQADTLLVRAPEIQIGVQRSTMQPSVRYITQRTHAVISRLSTQVVTVSVQGETGPIPCQTVNLLSTAKDGTAGHINHPANTKPRGGFGSGGFSLQVNTDSTGVKTVTFVAPDPSGPITITGTMSGARKGVAPVDVRVSGLVRLPSNNPTYVDTGYTSIHPDNQWMSQNHLNYLSALASAFYIVTGKKLRFNDSSLETGGLFDNVDNTGFWTYPHRTHRFGRETDLGKDLTADDKKIVRWLWKEKYKGAVEPESDHWHLTI